MSLQHHNPCISVFKKNFSLILWSFTNVTLILWSFTSIRTPKPVILKSSGKNGNLYFIIDQNSQHKAVFPKDPVFLPAEASKTVLSMYEKSIQFSAGQFPQFVNMFMKNKKKSIRSSILTVFHN